MIKDSELMLDVSQAHELKLAFRRNGWNNAEIKRLSEGDLLAKVRSYLINQRDIMVMKKGHIIDCDADPLVPEGWKVVEHRKGGLLEWDPSNVWPYLSEKQKGSQHISGKKLRKELVDKPVLNANVRDYLLANTSLIPKSWEGKRIFFWGTIYDDGEGRLYVSCLELDDNGKKWRGNKYPLNLIFKDHFLIDKDFSSTSHLWGSNRPAALLANKQ